jgi:chemotaxis signal transduction protein
MEGPFDPQHPGQDAGASQPEAQDSDLHALLERLLGQGDLRPADPGAGDDLWPAPMAAAPIVDEVSTIVPAPDAPETPTAVAELPTAIDEPVPEASVELAPVRAWEPVVVDAAASTNVDDIHAAILASVSLELEPIVPVAFEPPAAPEHGVDAAPPSLDALLDAALGFDAPTADVPLAYDWTLDTLTLETETPETLTLETGTLETVTPDAATLDEATPDTAPEAVASEAAVPFALTPFDASDLEPDDTEAFDGEPAEAEALAARHPDVDALWAAAVPELGLDVAPLLDLDTDADVDTDLAFDFDADTPLAPVAIVLPWPSQDQKPAASASPTAHDLIEAALAGLHADLTSEPVEPLRTPDVAVSTAHVVFHLGSRTMAIPLAAVSELARPPKVTRLPHVPAWVLGIANLRGDIVSMLDLEGFFSGKAGKSSHEQRMLALRPAGDEVRTAVLVDSVDGIQAFEDARVARVTRGYDAEVAPYARGLYQMENDLVVVLDADRLLQSKPMRQFEDGAGAR